jgi:hypothetical protein
MITKYDKRQGGGKTTKRGNFKWCCARLALLNVRMWHWSSDLQDLWGRQHIWDCWGYRDSPHRFKRQSKIRQTGTPLHPWVLPTNMNEIALSIETHVVPTGMQFFCPVNSDQFCIYYKFILAIF